MRGGLIDPTVPTSDVSCGAGRGGGQLNLGQRRFQPTGSGHHRQPVCHTSSSGVGIDTVRVEGLRLKARGPQQIEVEGDPRSWNKSGRGRVSCEKEFPRESCVENASTPSTMPVEVAMFSTGADSEERFL